MGLLKKYTEWLHTRWPAGTVEKLPEVRADGSTNVDGLYVVGDLTGIPLLKFSADTGAKAARLIAKQLASSKESSSEELDLVIIGAGVSGVSAAIEAKKAGLRFSLLEASEPFFTVANFPKGKPIFTYPSEMKPEGEFVFKSEVKEALLEEMRAELDTFDIQTESVRCERVERKQGAFVLSLGGEKTLRAKKVIVAIGRSGNFRRLGVPGEELDKVYNRLHDPKDYCGSKVLVVGGGDSALETAIALAQCGSEVSVSYRKAEFSRPKPDNVERLALLQKDPEANVSIEEPSSERVTTASGPFLTEASDAEHGKGSITLFMQSQVGSIAEDSVSLRLADASETTIENDVVFSMIGREAPLDFFRKSGVRIRGESSAFQWLLLAAFMLAVTFVYDWKADGFFVKQFPVFSAAESFPENAPSLVAGLGSSFAAAVQDRSTILGTLAISMKSRSFYYTLVYTLAIGLFGWARIRFRKTPYVKVQTTVLFLIQLFPLFLLPEFLLPYLGYNGFFDAGVGKSIADALFEPYISAGDLLAQNWPDWGHPRAYWRAYGLILAWPLMIYNVFTNEPMTAWLVISCIQTFVLIPALVYYFGKGAYCGWICSCGALAETVGDRQRHKMPHGPKWNRLNMLGQAILFIAFALLLVRVLGWIWPESVFASYFSLLSEGKSDSGELVNLFSYKWVVDVFFGGVLGVGLYFKYSGRVWCRFACPLAALMHIYSRFSRFRIVADKKKCISCNQCTSVCHQGIDIMNFANKGLAMNDPQCVRCSACVQSCPTGVLQFAQVKPKTGELVSLGKLSASPVLMRE